MILLAAAAAVLFLLADVVSRSGNAAGARALGAVALLALGGVGVLLYVEDRQP